MRSENPSNNMFVISLMEMLISISSIIRKDDDLIVSLFIMCFVPPQLDPTEWEMILRFPFVNKEIKRK